MECLHKLDDIHGYLYLDKILVFKSVGVDTIGGIRIPAAFCGILGYSASHGLISMVGVTHVAPSLDVVGNYYEPCYQQGICQVSITHIHFMYFKNHLLFTFQWNVVKIF